MVKEQNPAWLAPSASKGVGGEEAEGLGGDRVRRALWAMGGVYTLFQQQWGAFDNVTAEEDVIMLGS